MTTHSYFRVWLILCLSCSISILGSWLPKNFTARAATSENGEDKYVYIFGDQAEFAKVELRDLQVTAKGVLSQVVGFSGELPEYVPSTAAHAPNPWPGINVLYDAKTQRIFAAVPGEATATDFSNFSILVIRIPNFELIGKIPFPSEVNELPSIALSPDGQQLFSNCIFPNGKEEVSLLDVYTTSDLKKLRSFRETMPISNYVTGTSFGNKFGPSAYASSDGKTIYEGEYFPSKLTLSTSSSTTESLGREYSGPVVGGKVQRIEVDPSSHERSISVFDLESNRVIGSKIHIPPSGNQFLSSDGKRLVFLGTRIDREERPTGGTKGVGYLTGELIVYYVADGTEIRTLTLPSLAGEMGTYRMLCMSPDGEHLIFQAGKTALFDVAPTSPSGAQAIPVRMNLGESPRCIFTTEPARSMN